MRIQLSDHFTTGKLLRFVAPSIVMMIFTSIYGVVDGLFVSNYAGKTAFAAINLVMPFIMVLGGIGFMIGTGGTALVSKILGEGDQEKAKRYFSMMILFTVLVGAVLTAVGVVDTIVTEMGVIRVTRDGLELTERFADYSVEQIQAATEAPLNIGTNLKVLETF